MLNEGHISSAEIILATFPRIEEQLLTILTRFNIEIETTLDPKNKISPYANPATTDVLNCFPRQYDGYKECVDTYVNFGCHSVDAAISVLLEILPNRNDNELYQRIVSKSPFYSGKTSLFDLFLVTFFADCIAQILTANTDTTHYKTLIQICYAYISPLYEPHEEPLRKQLVSQLSVIFSLISIHHLDIILTEFPNVILRSDPVLTLILHRFVRLSVSTNVKFDDLGRFLECLEQTGSNEKKGSKLLNVWASTLCTLISQFNNDPFPEVKRSFTKIYNLAIKKTHERLIDYHFMLLCSIILLRDETLYNEHFQDFFIKLILEKASKQHRTLSALHAFLAVLRGYFMARGSLFWEWGSYNNNGHPGIEATHLRDPDQDQSKPDSYTSLFFKYFVSCAPIEDYPDLVGQILVNLAARDFTYFSQTTIPKFIQEMGNERCLYPLYSALSLIVDPCLHFAEWAQSNPLNTKIQVSASIGIAFVQLKTFLFTLSSKLKIPHRSKYAFCFNLSDSSEFPQIRIPFHTIDPPIAMKTRIKNSTAKAESTLKEWRLVFPQDDKEINFKKFVVEKITEDERKYLEILFFYPRIINTSDLTANNFTSNFLNNFLVSSPAIAYYSVAILNHIFVYTPENRLVIFIEVIQKLSSLRHAEHIFIMLQFLVKLLDLSLEPKGSDKEIQGFILASEAIAVYLLAYPYAEIRDLTINLIERINRFADNNRMESVLYKLMFDGSQLLMKAVKSRFCFGLEKIPESDIVIRTAASSRYTPLFRFYLHEIMIVLKSKAQPNLLRGIQSFVSTTLSNYKTEEILNNWRYSNLVTLLLNSYPVLGEEEHKTLKSLFVNDKISSYEIKVLTSVNNPSKKVLANNQSAIDIIKKILPLMNENAGLITEIFQFMSWEATIFFVPQLEAYAKNNCTSNIDLLNCVAKILVYVVQNPDITFALYANDKVTSSILSIISLFEQYFAENKLNTQYKGQFDANIDGKNQKLAIAFCVIVTFFLNAMVIENDVNDFGPLRAPLSTKWLESNLFNDSVRITLGFLMNWTSVGKRLAREAANAVSAIVRISTAKDIDFDISLEKILLESELDRWPTFKYALPRYIDSIMRLALSHSYDTRPEISAIYFNAICSMFIPQETVKRRYGVCKLSSQSFSKSTHVLIQSKRYSSSSPLMKDVSENDIAFNKKVFKYAGNLVFYALFFLMHESYDVRFLSFRMLQRIAPLLLIFFNPDDEKSAQEVVSSLDKLAPTFYSNIVASSSQSVLKVAQIFAASIPQIKETLIQECFLCLSLRFKANMQTANQDTLLECVNTFIKSNSLMKDGTFNLFTPVSFLSSLLNVYDSLDHNALHAYFLIWSTIGHDPDSIDFETQFLLHISTEEKYKSAIQAVIIHLAKDYREKVIDALSSHLSFSYWFFSNMQGKFNSDEIPELKPLTSAQVLLSTLSEIAHYSVDALKPHFSTILSFSFLYYDELTSTISELLFIILNGLPDLPETITSRFLPPYSLDWNPKTIEKHSLLDTIIEIIDYFNSKKEKSLLKTWGQEMMRWVCGCGSLITAARAALILSKLYTNFSHKNLYSIIKSASIVATAPISETTQLYLMSVFQILTSFVDQFMSNRSNSSSIEFIYHVALPFISFPECSDLCSSALTIVVKFLLHGLIPKDDIPHLLIKFADLSVTLKNKKVLDGAFLTLFQVPDARDICITAFIIYLPRLYAAFAAFHNQDPFTLSLSDEEIPTILQIGQLMNKEDIIPVQLSFFLREALKDPTSVSADDFVLQICYQLAMAAGEKVMEAAPILLQMASKASPAELCAIFTVIRCLIEYPELKDGIEAFSGVVTLASCSVTREANQLLETFINLSTQAPEAPSSQSQDRLKLKTMIIEWDSIGKDLSTLIDSHEQTELPEGETDLDKLIQITPLVKNLWQDEAVKKIRSKLTKTKVQPFSGITRHMSKSFSKKPKNSAVELQIPTKFSLYLRSSHSVEQTTK